MKHGKELQSMLEGNKPMSVFYRAISDMFDEKSGQDFSRFVKSGRNETIKFLYQKYISRFL
jgi:protein gp37